MEKIEIGFYPQVGDIFSARMIDQKNGMLYLVLNSSPSAKINNIRLKTLNPITGKIYNMEWDWSPSTTRIITLISRLEK